jgi:integral membrane protein
MTGTADSNRPQEPSRPPKAPTVLRTFDETTSRRVASALGRYRVMAWVTGVWLLALCAELIAHYGFGDHSFWWVGVVHGWVYFVYFLMTCDLAIKARWLTSPAGVIRTVAALCAGFIPFLSFFLEHRNTATLRAALS